MTGGQFAQTAPGQIPLCERVSRTMLAIGLLPILLVLIVAIVSLVEPRFTGLFNILNILRQTSFLAIVACGQMLVLIVGGVLTVELGSERAQRAREAD